MGLWGTMYGFIAIDKDLNTIQGLTFYKHKETPGLGAEIDNPNWKAKWPGRLIHDDSGNIAIKVIKGPAASPSEAPHQVDGLSGATLTSNGVTNLLKFWLGDNGFGPYLQSLGGKSLTEGSDI
jgi:Na+-transporting NADH:ubiquinone oxidoreductase subunit C